MRPSVRRAARFAPPFPCRGGGARPAYDDHDLPIGQLRWGPPPAPEGDLTFVAGVRTMTTAGDVDAQTGMSAALYFVNQSMADDYFYDADGELLVSQQAGKLVFLTELGRIEVGPGHVCVIPRGVKFKVELVEGPARGYLCESSGAKFTLPNRGPIGARLPRQSARLQDADRRFRGQGDPVPAHIQEMVRQVLSMRDRPLAARRRRLAWQLCAPGGPISAPSRLSARSCSIIPTRRSSRC